MVKAMTFDVFGTVVDWRSSIIREGEALQARTGIEADWAAFADAWRGGYGPAMRRGTSGELSWTKIDVLHRMILDDLIPEYGLTSLDEKARDHLNRVWHRLTPWSDSVSGLTRLKTRYTLATLSNGNVALLGTMDFQATLTKEAVIEYMTKYMTKSGQGSLVKVMEHSFSLCIEKVITSYPSWEINGIIESGGKSLNELADITGYKGQRDF